MQMFGEVSFRCGGVMPHFRLWLLHSSQLACIFLAQSASAVEFNVHSWTKSMVHNYELEKSAKMFCHTSSSKIDSPLLRLRASGSWGVRTWSGGVGTVHALIGSGRFRRSSVTMSATSGRSTNVAMQLWLKMKNCFVSRQSATLARAPTFAAINVKRTDWPKLAVNRSRVHMSLGLFTIILQQPD